VPLVTDNGEAEVHQLGLIGLNNKQGEMKQKAIIRPKYLRTRY